ncbi:TIGR03826 family flagellar region protein [Paenibacillus thiaminolyticus]|uniref:Flagellar protein n=1 Tax=Paenibacillus thiaminolyticus TaxID=49283 RepID=A0A3A3GPB4_PANTH|nr:TIGR03826 family flagellar region protein [Paenibacillus thiaminolyticus]RJG24844.1 flagellar protein [Paenibacillus thiaminolyticus]
MELGNCPRCGRLFAKAFRDICPACLKEIEQEYERCVAYLREQQHASMHELSEETKVSPRQITQFIREGRISEYQAPNLAYDCEVCGNPIREGHMCEPCRTRLVRQIQEAGIAKEPDKGEAASGTRAYQAFDPSRNK